MITQGGKRNGANMAVMNVYHPDILEFIDCKHVEGDIHNFNISVGADSNFMEAVKDDEYINLTWPMDQDTYTKDQLRKDQKVLRARDLFNKIIEGINSQGETECQQKETNKSSGET